jgi:hypothetical protein
VQGCGLYDDGGVICSGRGSAPVVRPFSAAISLLPCVTASRRSFRAHSRLPGSSRSTRGAPYSERAHPTGHRNQVGQGRTQLPWWWCWTRRFRCYRNQIRREEEAAEVDGVYFNGLGFDEPTARSSSSRHPSRIRGRRATTVPGTTTRLTATLRLTVCFRPAVVSYRNATAPAQSPAPVFIRK